MRGNSDLRDGEIVIVPTVTDLDDPLRPAVEGRFLHQFAGATVQGGVQIAGGGQGAVLLAPGVVHQLVLAVVVIAVAAAASVADYPLIPPGQPAVAVAAVNIFCILAYTVVWPDRGQGGVIITQFIDYKYGSKSKEAPAALSLLIVRASMSNAGLKPSSSEIIEIDNSTCSGLNPSSPLLLYSLPSSKTLFII